jgi:hypothetical protein
MSYLSAKYETTKEIKSEFNKNTCLEKVNFYKPFVQYRLYEKKQAVQNLWDSGFTCLSCQNASNYEIIPQKTDAYKRYSNVKIFSKLKRKVNIQQPSLTINDSLFIVRELLKIKALFKVSLVNTYPLNDSLYNILIKYPADQHIFLDVIIEQHYLLSGPGVNTWGLVKMYVFDVQERKMIFYNYKSNCGKNSRHTYDPYSINSVRYRLPLLILHYKRYLKKNRKNCKALHKIK